MITLTVLMKSTNYEASHNAILSMLSRILLATLFSNIHPAKYRLLSDVAIDHQE
jgi:hypothetical protein